MDQNKYLHAYITIIFERNVGLGTILQKKRKQNSSTAKIKIIIYTMFDDSFISKIPPRAHCSTHSFSQRKSTMVYNMNQISLKLEY